MAEGRSRIWIWFLVGGGLFALFVVAVFTLVYLSFGSRDEESFSGFGSKIAVVGLDGSGKTEVYLTAIETALAEGRSALLMVPEIALTPQMAGQFFARFGDRVAILHSAFTDVERTEQWRRIRSGVASVVVDRKST